MSEESISQTAKQPRLGVSGWNVANADRFRLLESQGVDPQTAWQATGTWRGVDGKLRQYIPKGVSSLKGYGAPSPTAEFLGGFKGVDPRFSVMDPQAQELRQARELGEQVSVAGQLFGAAAPFAAASTVARAGQIPGASMAVNRKPSKAENIARGLYHPIGEGKKLEKPVSEMEFTQEVIKDLPSRQIISPERLQGAAIVPATGDRTAAGRMLTEIEGVRFPSPVALEGGPDFMRTHKPFGAAWASDLSAVTGKENALAERIRQAAGKSSGDVYMIYTPMSHVGGDFSTMMSDALLQQIRGGKITKKAKKEFDEEVRKFRPEWKGIDDPTARDQLNANGALRHAFIDRMTLDKFKTAGFPDLPTTRAAITEQSLMDAPIHAGGFAVAKMDPTGRIITDSPAPHTTYNTQLAGEYAGGFETPIPREILFSDFTQARRAAGTDPAGDMRSFQLSNPVQKASQEWVDNLMKFIESTRTGQ
ncbi:MAG: hypothetical protein EB117_12745 [Betaproteobacteria bacterium]|nr:hypothetical protein [Betaproteobacteria bacterium]